MVLLLPVAAPAPTVAARRRQAAPRELERDLVGHADRPRAAADGDISPGVDEARADDGEPLGDAVGGVALADPAEIEADARLQLDRRPVTRTAPPQRAGASLGPRVASELWRRTCGRSPPPTTASWTVGSKRPPVASRAASASSTTRTRSGLASVDPAVPVEPGELAVVTEARHQLLEALELGFCPVERAARRARRGPRREGARCRCPSP